MTRHFSSINKLLPPKNKHPLENTLDPLIKLQSYNRANCNVNFLFKLSTFHMKFQSEISSFRIAFRFVFFFLFLERELNMREIKKVECNHHWIYASLNKHALIHLDAMPRRTHIVMQMKKRRRKTVSHKFSFLVAFSFLVLFFYSDYCEIVCASDEILFYFFYFCLLQFLNSIFEADELFTSSGSVAKLVNEKNVQNEEERKMKKNPFKLCNCQRKLVSRLYTIQDELLFNESILIVSAIKSNPFRLKPTFYLFFSDRL